MTPPICRSDRLPAPTDAFALRIIRVYGTRSYLRVSTAYRFQWTVGRVYSNVCAPRETTAVFVTVCKSSRDTCRTLLRFSKFTARYEPASAQLRVRIDDVRFSERSRLSFLNRNKKNHRSRLDFVIRRAPTFSRTARRVFGTRRMHENIFFVLRISIENNYFSVIE